MSRTPAAPGLLAALVVLGLAGTAVAQAPGPQDDGWRPFEATWSAVGTRHFLPTEGARPAGIAQLSGTVLLTVGAELHRGFRGEAIYFDDGSGAGAGRSVWTDESGDRIFGALKGEPVETGTRIVGTVTGGTGRYAGITGEYTLVWQFVVEAEPGVFQGRTVTIKGRYRAAGATR